MIPEAAAITNTLAEGLGNDTGAIWEWWRTPRHELHDRTPRQWLLGGGAAIVVADLAERDVAAALADARA